MQEQFRRVQEEYLRLREQFAAGFISAEEFDAALQNLQVEDGQGRVWMLGANTGRWYYASSPRWVEADPVQSANGEADAVQNAVSTHETSLAVVDGERQNGSRRALFAHAAVNAWKNPTLVQTLGFGILGVGVALLLAAILFFTVFSPQGLLLASADPNPTATRIVPRAAVAVIPATAVPTLATATSTRRIETFRTPLPATATPALVIGPTSSDPVMTLIPSITPNPNPGRARPEESNSSVPPAVYVTNIRVFPNPPPKRFPVTFTVSFWNTNRESVPMNWRIILLDPYQGGRTRDYGESPFAGVTVPPGRTEYSITFSPVNSRGPCVSLEVLAARRQDDNSRVYLLSPGGNPYAGYFTFC